MHKLTRVMRNVIRDLILFKTIARGGRLPYVVAVVVNLFTLVAMIVMRVVQPVAHQLGLAPFKRIALLNVLQLEMHLQVPPPVHVTTQLGRQLARLDLPIIIAVK